MITGNRPIPAAPREIAIGPGGRTRKLENDGFAMLGGYNGRLLVTAGNHEVRVHDRAGKTIATTPHPGQNVSPFFAAEGKELWVVDHASRKVERYKLPE